MPNTLRITALVIALLAVGALAAQSSLQTVQDAPMIVLRNASFEDMPRNSAPPRGWIDCGDPLETPPDVHPDPEFAFRVSKPAFHKNTYLGMVTRENETFEAVGQKLTQSFLPDQCYELRINLARSEVYLSASRRSNQPSNYVNPIVLRVWGGYSICDRGQLLGQSNPVKNFDWQEYRVKLEPERAYTHLILEVYYKPQSMIPYNGNILLDNARPLMPIRCDEDLSVPAEPAEPSEPLAAVQEPDSDIETQPVVPRSVPSPPASDPVVNDPKPETPKVRLGKTEAVLKEGAVFAVEDINFKSNSSELETNSEESLQEIVQFLRANQDVIVEIGGHTNRKAGSQYASELSESRAKAVVEYLRTHSIPSNRLLSKGYGNRRPVCLSTDPACDRRNQRVEVKILRLTR